jgi:hypothetical protein
MEISASPRISVLRCKSPAHCTATSTGPIVTRAAITRILDAEQISKTWYQVVIDQHVFETGNSRLLQSGQMVHVVIKERKAIS